MRHDASFQITLEQLDLVSEGCWLWNIDTGEEYISPKFKSTFGYEDSEIENSQEGWMNIIHPEDKEKAIDVCRKHVAGQAPYYLECRYRHKNGKWVWTLCRGHRITIPEDSHQYLLGTHTDITRLKEAEMEIIRLSTIRKSLMKELSSG